MQSLPRLICSLTLALLGLALAPPAAHATILGFGDFSNFTVNEASWDSDPVPTQPAPGAIELTHFGGIEDRSIFYNVPQSISRFTATFTYQAMGGYDGNELGGAFVLQNSSQGENAVGDNFGYGGIGHSAAISFELGTSGQTGLYTGGNTGGGSASTSPVNLLSGDPNNFPFIGDPINVTLVYNGTTLRESLTDTATSATFSTVYFVNLASVLGSSTALVGFTAGGEPEFDRFQDKQLFSNFQFVPEPSSMVMAIGAGIGGLFLSLRRGCRG